VVACATVPGCLTRCLRCNIGLETLGLVPGPVPVTHSARLADHCCGEVTASSSCDYWLELLTLASKDQFSYTQVQVSDWPKLPLHCVLQVSNSMDTQPPASTGHLKVKCVPDKQQTLQVPSHFAGHLEGLISFCMLYRLSNILRGPECCTSLVCGTEAVSANSMQSRLCLLVGKGFACAG